MRSRAAAIGLLTAVLGGVPEVASARCEDSPAPKVDWQRCNKRDADLRDKDLQGARLDGVTLDRGNLSGATWIDGRVCSLHSIGACNQ